MFKTRLLSGILLVIIALATIISGDYVLFFTLLAVSLIGMRELYRAMKVQDEKINLLAAAGYLGAVLYYLAVLLDFERYGVLAIIFGLVLLMFVYVFTYPTYEAGQVCLHCLVLCMWQLCCRLFILPESFPVESSTYG